MIEALQVGFTDMRSDLAQGWTTARMRPLTRTIRTNYYPRPGRTNYYQRPGRTNCHQRPVRTNRYR